jgi:GntR family transcriptional regulator / MocR family aminotransferase
MSIPVDSFYLDPDVEGTLQQKVQRLVAEGILSGRFRQGEKLPSSRKLALHLGISRITVTNAYTELLSDDYLKSRGRSGYFVSDTAPVPSSFEPPAKPDRGGIDWSRAIGQRFSSPGWPIRPKNWKDYPYPFIYGQADPNLFSHQTWRQCALQALGQRDFSVLTADYYEQDDDRLLEYIQRHILPRRGIAARKDQILITLGAQNALWMTAQILLTQRRVAAMENPAYPGLREILGQTRCRTVAVDVDAYGLPPAALPQDTDVVFATVSHHCPTNVTMPLGRRKDLLRLAEQRGFVIVEDEYEFELSFKGAPSPSLKSMDRSGLVIHIGSFSKSLFPGLRLGYIVASEEFIQEARGLRGLVLRHPPGHIQRTVAYFLSLGHYDAQINRMRQAYERRRTVMTEAITREGLHFAEHAGTGGSSFWMIAPEGVDTEKLATRLDARGVVIEPGRGFFGADHGPSRHYRLAYSSIHEDKIPQGIRLIADEIRRFGPMEPA